MEYINLKISKFHIRHATYILNKYKTNHLGKRNPV